MNYKEMYNKAKKEGKTQEVTFTSWDNPEVGQNIIGKLETVRDIHFEDNDSDAKQYIFDTDDGRIGVIFGAITDANNTLEIGKVFCAEFKGKKDLSKGRTAKIWSIEEIQV